MRRVPHGWRRILATGAVAAGIVLPSPTAALGAAVPLRSGPPVATLRAAVSPWSGSPVAALGAARGSDGRPPVAASSPFASDEDGATAGRGSRSAAADRPSTARLDRVAAVLRRSPLAVDPELQWTLGAGEQRALVRRLRAARIPVLVAVLPTVDEDESGGDQERVLQTLQRRVGRDALYVVVDQDGRMDLASVGIPLDLGIPYSLLTPRYDSRSLEEQARDPAPAGWTSISERLGGILDAVEKAEPGTPNAVIDDVDPLEPLSGRDAADREREDTIAASISGLVVGLFAAGTVLGVGAAVRGARSAGGPGRTGGRGGTGGTGGRGGPSGPGGRGGTGGPSGRGGTGGPRGPGRGGTGTAGRVRSGGRRGRRRRG